MDRRDFSAKGKPGRDGTADSAAARASAGGSLARAQLIVECTRAILRGRSEAELASAVCRLLVHPGIYDDAGIAFVDGAVTPTFDRAYYAGPDQTCAGEPAAYWAVPARQASLAAVLANKAAARAGAGGLPVMPLRLDGRVLGAISVSPSGQRAADAEELEQLQCLADDICCALSRLRESAPQRALAASERRLRETVEHAGVGITRIDMNGRFIEVNQKFCEMLGYTREELIGRATREVTLAEDYGPGAAFRAQAQLGRASVHIGEKRYLRKDGSHLWVRRTMSPAFDESGSMRDAISIVEDITERKAAEESARNERTLLRTIIDALPHVIYVKDVAGRFTLVNAAWHETRRIPPGEVHGRTARDLFPEQDARRMEAQDQPVLAGASMIDLESSVAAADGTVRWVSTTKVPLRDVAGNVIGLVGISRDVTEGKRFEKELRDSVERFEIAARATSDVIWDWDLGASTIWWGEALEQRFGYSREAMGSSVESWTSRIHPADVDSVNTGVRRAVEDGARFWSADYRFQRADGTWADVYDRAYLIRDEAGRATRLLGAMMDISERKVTEEAIGRERALLRTIIDALPDYIHVKDAEGRIQLGNRAWLEARGLAGTDVRGKTVFDLFPPAVAQRMEEQDRQIFESGEGFFEQEQPIFLLDEGGNRLPRWSSTTKVPMRDDAGNIVGVVGISRDITSRRRMERERAMEHVVAHVLSESRSVAQTIPRLIRTVCEAMNWAYGAYWVWNAESKSLQRVEWWCEFEPAFEPADAEYWREITAPHVAGLLGKAWLEQRATWVTEVEEMGEGFRRSASCRKFGFRSAYAFPILADDEPVGVIEFFARDTREPDEALLEVSGAISNQIGQFVRRKRAEESLQENEQQLRAMFENADVGIAVTGLDMRYLRVNDKYCSIIGYEREELLRMRAVDVNLEANLAEMRDRRSRMLEEPTGSNSSEKQLVRKDGSLVWVSVASSLVRSSDGAPRYFIAVVQDVSESKRAAEALKESEEQYRVLAHYDILTGLPNRALFYDRLAHALAQARRNRWWLAVMFIDVDRFKNVNDTMGHAAGDMLLKQISERLSECVRGEDTVGRLSGDEFAVVLTRLSAPEDAANVAKKIVGEFNRAFLLEGTELFVTSSIGITVFPTDTVEQDTLIRNADVAMYRAKDRGRNNYQFYTPELNKRTREMLSMEGELRRAIERDEFVLHYQPKVNLASGTVTGVEALLRWRHPERGLVPPGDFIPLLEETGLVVRAGDWVLRAVCRQLVAWRECGLKPVSVAVNLSARQFLAPDLGPTIRAILEEHGVSPELLEVEITESAIMQDAEEAKRTLEYLQALGVNSAVDDFGTGYSSLGYLKRFPLRALKIDRSFVNEITTDEDDAHITQAVITMAHSLGLKVVAEGVETEAQLAYLLRYDCDEVQGYLFARPMPGDDCAAAIVDEAKLAAIIEPVRSGRQ